MKTKANWHLLSQYKSELYGLTILWIMLFHSYLAGVNFFHLSHELSAWGNGLIQHGNVGVDMFLFLAGIFCFFSYSRQPDLLTFMKKRFSRLWFPVLLIDGVYWLFLLLTGASSIWKFILRCSLLNFWLTGDQLIWFVSLILVCYLLYPAIYRLIYPKGELKFRTLLIILSFVVLLTVAMHQDAADAYRKIEIGITRLPVFLLGCGCGKLVKEQKNLPPLLLPACAAAILVSLVVFRYDLLSNLPLRYFGVVGIAYVILFAWLLGRLNCQPLNGFLRFFGKRSLQLYLAHILLINLYQRSSFYVPESRLRYLTLLGCSVVIAFAADWIQDTVTKALQKQQTSLHL